MIKTKDFIIRICVGLIITALLCIWWTPWAGLAYALLWVLADEIGAFVVAKNLTALREELDDLARNIKAMQK